ncbi:MAG TPA: DUF2334 domain-containing protein, partial [Clostridium sp.]
LNFDNMPISEITDVTLNILNEHNIKNIPMLLKSQRYYIPMKFICNKLLYTVSNNGPILLQNPTRAILLTGDTYKTNSSSGSLRGNLLTYKDEYYLSISDIEQLFGLTAIFDFNTKSISLLPCNVGVLKSQPLENGENIAMFRLEDFAASDSLLSAENQGKVKCIGDFLYSEGIKYHIAWIPRFKSPTDNIDNNLLENNSIQNVGFVNLLDYLINKGAQVGLHGYTHQSGNEISGIGADLSKDANNTISATKNVIENGLETANALNIPISFFESAHFKETKLQQKVLEEYFQFIYDPFNVDNISKLYKTKRNNLYVPCPLDYVKNLDVSPIIAELKDTNSDKVKSFFYHPYIELAFVNFNTNNNTLNVQYSEDSPLKKIVKGLEDNNYATIHIDQLKKAN